ncbi:hypothetical protein SS50377_21105 [Spironucleus salmonicida]|uniref:Uncharacterized protein n=1 Tax=Spironucleus salmonicida TaxID=348837 RepID=V6LH73_9EUKA|nr:hypothetical protein SS50377_21105 [Spironucleus salmonicida]|eukprot:EST43887.1 Hypothetical protein SS50377_16187 [Spironucleus salmonicida]
MNDSPSLYLGSMNCYLMIDNHQIKIPSFIYVQNGQRLSQRNTSECKYQMYTHFANSHVVPVISQIFSHKQFQISTLGYSNLFFNKQDILPALTTFFETLSLEFNFTRLVINAPILSISQLTSIQISLKFTQIDYVIHQFDCGQQDVHFIDFNIYNSQMALHSSNITIYSQLLCLLKQLQQIERVSNGSIFQLICYNYDQILNGSLHVSQICRDLGVNEDFLLKISAQLNINIQNGLYMFDKALYSEFTNFMQTVIKIQNTGTTPKLCGELACCSVYNAYPKCASFSPIDIKDKSLFIVECNGQLRFKNIMLKLNSKQKFEQITYGIYQGQNEILIQQNGQIIEVEVD